MFHPHRSIQYLPSSGCHPVVQLEALARAGRPYWGGPLLHAAEWPHTNPIAWPALRRFCCRNNAPCAGTDRSGECWHGQWALTNSNLSGIGI